MRLLTINQGLKFRYRFKTEFTAVPRSESINHSPRKRDHCCDHAPLSLRRLCPLTSDDQLTLVLHHGGLVAGDAGVVAVVQQRQVGDAQRAGEVDVVDGDAQAGGDGPPVLLPRDEDRLVTRHHHARDEHPLADGEARELERMDGGWHCGDVMEVVVVMVVVKEVMGVEKMEVALVVVVEMGWW